MTAERQLELTLKSKIKSRSGIVLGGNLSFSWTNSDSRTHSIRIVDEYSTSYDIPLPKDIEAYSWPNTLAFYKLLINCIGKKRTLIKKVI